MKCRLITTDTEKCLKIKSFSSIIKGNPEEGIFCWIVTMVEYLREKKMPELGPAFFVCH
jgi:hypothetical protein